MTTLDARIDALVSALEEMKRTHPNVAGVWEAHLNSRRAKLIREVERGEKVISLFEHREDLPLEVLRDISVVARVITTNNT